MAKITDMGEKIAKSVTESYQKIEDGVVGGYKKIEEGVVDGFTKVSDKFIDVLFTKEGETAEDAKARMKKTFRLKAANGQTIAVSESYTSKDSCLNGIESVKRSANGAPVKQL